MTGTMVAVARCDYRGTESLQEFSYPNGVPGGNPVAALAAGNPLSKLFKL